MPLNVRRNCLSLALVPAALGTFAFGQTTTPSSTPSATNTATTPAPVTATPAPTSGDIMRDRITKAKAFIAVRNYNAAIYELENLRKESADPAVQGVVNVLLMNSYLEQGDYTRAQNFLRQFFNDQKTTKANALAAYTAVAGQVIKGARGRADRFKALGLNVGDRMLPLEALNDLEKMRETLEMVVTQSKEIGQTPAKVNDAMALLEEATTSRAALARDEYDAKRWRDEIADTREQMTSARAVVMTAVPKDGVSVPDLVASNAAVNQPASTPADTSGRGRVVPGAPVAASLPPTMTREMPTPREQPPSTAESGQPSSAPVQVAKTDTPKEQPQPSLSAAGGSSSESAKTEPAATGPIDVGSLVGYATSKPSPVVPAAARAMRTSGTVRVDVTIDEAGEVAEVKSASGPVLLVAAAKDAIKRWKFKPFVRDGQPVKANGYVSFNFAL